MDEKIKKFLANSHLLTLSVIDCEQDLAAIGVYSASCYYAFMVESLLIKSSADSKHIKLAELNPNISVTIAKDSKNLSKIEGIQIKAYFRKALAKEKKAYYARFPFARLGSGEIFALDILWAKYTNNALLKKVIYIKE
ncbi:hypothetical protein LS70_008885 [Helicobacter sp. MIT 11-5569]|uniref:hypothetical protein n=1 Tax=Helicobacter sp. MIT 11-5569 TaxID=1548151 RepID=UPI00051FF214|nr:hypothetical protein [Helicobacter sp. MIT 11-5569]TLD80675.1 hypothetical protein LS70_008885 [Helicobacter sp. MIT 11-5569]